MSKTRTVVTVRAQPLGSSGRSRVVLSVAGICLFLAVWSLLSYSGAVNSLLLPTPSRVVGAGLDIGWALWLHVAATLLRVVAGFMTGLFFGISIGIAMQYSRAVFQLLDGIIETIRPVPPVAAIPFVILIFGFAESGKLFIVSLGVCVIVVVTVVEGIERVSPSILRWGIVSGVSRAALFKLVVLPAAWPHTRSGLRIALALAVSLVVVSEFLGATRGLGYLINVSKVTLTTPTIFLCVILLGWVGWFLDRALRAVYDLTTQWEYRAQMATRHDPVKTK